MEERKIFITWAMLLLTSNSVNTLEGVRKESQKAFLDVRWGWLLNTVIIYMTHCRFQHELSSTGPLFCFPQTKSSSIFLSQFLSSQVLTKETSERVSLLSILQTAACLNTTHSTLCHFHFQRCTDCFDKLFPLFEFCNFRSSREQAHKNDKGKQTELSKKAKGKEQREKCIFSGKVKYK